MKSLTCKAPRFPDYACRMPRGRQTQAPAAQPPTASSVLRRWGLRAELTLRPPGQQGRAAALHARVTAHALSFGLDAPALKAILGMRAGVAHYLAHCTHRRTRPQARMHAIVLCPSVTGSVCRQASHV